MTEEFRIACENEKNGDNGRLVREVSITNCYLFSIFKSDEVKAVF